MQSCGHHWAVPTPPGHLRPCPCGDRFTYVGPAFLLGSHVGEASPAKWHGGPSTPAGILWHGGCRVFWSDWLSGCYCPFAPLLWRECQGVGLFDISRLRASAPNLEHGGKENLVLCSPEAPTFLSRSSVLYTMSRSFRRKVCVEVGFNFSFYLMKIHSSLPQSHQPHVSSSLPHVARIHVGQLGSEKGPLPRQSLH